MENISYLTKELTKDNDLYDVILENSIMRELLEGNVPILLFDDKIGGKINRLKDTEEVFLSSVSDLSGILTPEFDKSKFESEKYMLDNKEIDREELISRCSTYVNNKPEWLVKFINRCNMEPNKLHLLAFREIEKATLSVLSQLTNIIDTRKVDGKWELPDNARIVLIGTDIKRDNIVMEGLYKRGVSLEINSSIENWLRLRTLEDIPNSLEYKKKNIVFDPDLLAYVLCKFWKDKEDVLDLSYNVNKLCVISKLMREFNKEDVLKLFMEKEHIEEFFSFCNKENMNIDDVINDNYFSNRIDEDISRDVLMYFRILSEKDIDKRRKAASNFVRYDCENNGLILCNLYLWTDMNDGEKLLNLINLAKNTTMIRLFEKKDSNRLVK